jgi:hypothetical protein
VAYQPNVTQVFIGETFPRERILLPPRFIQRLSTAPPRVALNAVMSATARSKMKGY